MKKLIKIQNELKAPKNQYNNFGKYKYRSCEDILEALKPLLLKHECTVNIEDKIQEVGGIVFIESRVCISDGENEIYSTAQAGINPDRKGMDIAQSFGSSSSYARKYALNGLFLIDDTKDPDTQKPPEVKKVDEKGIKLIKGKLATITNSVDLTKYFGQLDMHLKTNKEVVKLFTEKKLDLQQS